MKESLFTLVATGMLLALIAVAFSVGHFHLGPTDLIHILWAKIFGKPHGLPEAYEAIVFQIRGPRILGAILIGAALSAAGAVYQNLFRNPLVSPDILGVSTGAACGAVIAIYLALPIIAIQGFAFAGGLGAVALVYLLGNAIRGHDATLTLILTGVVIGTLLGSVIAMLKYLADPYNQLPAITFWLLGSLNTLSPSDLAIAVPLIIMGLIPLYLFRWRMNILSLSEDEAQSLGINIVGLRILMITSATLITAASVAISGIIGWIGLLIPHATRMLVGAEFARMLPLTMLLGASFLLAVDTVARTLSTIEIPPGVLTALLGTPLFLWLLALSHAKQRQ